MKIQESSQAKILSLFQKNFQETTKSWMKLAKVLPQVHKNQTA